MSGPISQTPKVTCPECGGRKGYGARRCMTCAIRSYRAPSEARDPVAVFWSRVDRSGEPGACWPWIGPRDRDGYGLFRAPKATGRPTRRAHREAYELARGPIPDGHVIRHACDNPPCCNPAHLRTGTGLDNARDMVDRGRSLAGDRNPNVANVGGRPRGSRNGNSKLTEEGVAAIKGRLAAGEPHARIATDFGVTPGAIWFIAKGRNWTHVQPGGAA